MKSTEFTNLITKFLLTFLFFVLMMRTLFSLHLLNVRVATQRFNTIATSSTYTPIPTPRRRPSCLLFFRIVAYILLVSGLTLLMIFVPIAEYVKILQKFADKRPILGAVLLMCSHALAALLCLPTMPFYLALGLLYGIPLGILFTCSSYTVGASLNFIMGQYLIRPKLAEVLAAKPRYRQFSLAFETEGFWLALLLRAVSVFPWNALNICLSTTHLILWKFSLSTFFGIIPAMSIWVTLGATSVNILDPNASKTSLYFIIGIFIVFSILCAIISRKIKRSSQSLLRTMRPITQRLFNFKYLIILNLV
ncbi:hypothetical protein GEMRC1_007212 [Eukaryota sp. GEM-RC1]